jgi:preprotein translocase subunit YajC
MNLLNLFVTEAHAAAPTAAQGSGTGYEGLIMLVAMFAIFYFLLIRPQTKRAKAHRQLIDTLAMGDQVVTAGGIHGKVAGLQESVVVLEIASGVKIRINRASIVSSKTDGVQAD